MNKPPGPLNIPPSASFNAASLRLETSMIAIASYLARVAAEHDFKQHQDATSEFDGADVKGGPR